MSEAPKAQGCAARPPSSFVSGRRKRGPGRNDEADEEQRVEGPPPGAHLEQPLPERRRQHGNEDEHHHGERHDARHLPAGIEVAHDGDGDNAGRRGTEALHGACGKQENEARRERRDERSGDEYREPEHQNRLAAVAVRKPPIGELPDREPQHIADDDGLPVVGIGDPQGGADRRQRRQHDVDGKRGQRHHQRDERDELHLRQVMPRQAGSDCRCNRTAMLRCVHGPFLVAYSPRGSAGASLP